MDTEHIFIGDEFTDHMIEPTHINKRESIRNRVKNASTELTFYEEGFLRVREERMKARNIEYVLELRFLEREPVVTRKIAMPWLWTALVFGFLALLSTFVLPTTAVAQHTIPVMSALAVMALLSLVLFIYRSEVTFQFRTTSGQTFVLSLAGSFGCICRMREIAREIGQAILKATAEVGAHDARYLRAEMQAHYKLVETGVITREACADGTSLILAKFN